MAWLLSRVTGFIVAACVCPSLAEANDLRIVDAKGLIRAVRVVHNTSRVTISTIEPKVDEGECVASNVDGIASERREKISSQGECVFQGLAAGTWQVSLTTGARWRAKIDG